MGGAASWWRWWVGGPSCGLNRCQWNAANRYLSKRSGKHLLNEPMRSPCPEPAARFGGPLGISRSRSRTDHGSGTPPNSVARHQHRAARDDPPSHVRESRPQSPSLAQADGHLQGHGTPNTGPTHSQGGIETTPLHFMHCLLVPTVLTGAEHGQSQCGQAK
jgi:hypothetical protein